MLKIGDIIRKNRVEQRISQEELSFGICSVSNLSRIENGVQIPSRTTYEYLMERMGLSPLVFPSFRDERELETYRLKHEINQMCIAEKYEDVESSLARMKAMPKLERVDKQFVEYIDALLLLWNGAPPADVLEALLAVAQKSIKNISPIDIRHQVLSQIDISILNNLAASYYNAGKQELGIELLYSLKEYVEYKIVDKEGISPLYTAMLHKLTNWVGMKGNYSEVIELCDIGIKRCIEYGAYFSFAGLLFNKGYVLVMLGRKSEAHKYIQEAFYINRARGKMQSCDIVKGFAVEHGINLGE